MLVNSLAGICFYEQHYYKFLPWLMVLGDYVLRGKQRGSYRLVDIDSFNFIYNGENTMGILVATSGFSI